MRLAIGYELKSAHGKTVRKVVVCNDENEYRAVKRQIENAGYNLLTFDAMIKAADVLSR
jgi:hypothetical protein